MKFTEHGGITLRARSAGQAGGADRMRIAFDVTDTGIGIPEARIHSVFEEFTQAYSDTTRKYGGTGLGLSISKHLAELQGGSLSVESVPGEGSTFTAEIPYLLAPPEEKEAAPQDAAREPAPVHAGLHVLLAEDNEFNAMVAEDALADALPGVRVDVAANGEIAVRMARANPYDVILMDVQMPVMNGYDATRAIRALPGPKGRTPILAMTANVMKEEVARTREAGMDGFVPKPFKREELMNALRQALGDNAQAG